MEENMKREKVILALLLTAFLFINGCADWTHYNKERALEVDDTVFIDAKQRVVYKFARGIGEDSFTGICAEPSPDALSALASTLGLDFTLTDKAKLGFSHSLAETAGTIGIRTAAIAALRDIMYRNCEAYAMGAISDVGLESLQRRFTSTMIAILAIEQLTGAVRPPTIILKGSSSAGSPDAIVAIVNKTEKAKADHEAAKTAEEKAKGDKEKADKSLTSQEDAKKYLDDNSKIAEKIRDKPEDKRSKEENDKLKEFDNKKKEYDALKDSATNAKTAYETAQNTTKKKKEELAAMEEAKTAVLAHGGSAETSATMESISARAALSDEATKEIANTVLEIVKATTADLEMRREVCFTLLGRFPNTPIVDGSFMHECLEHMGSGDMKFVNPVLSNESLDSK